MTEQKQQTNHSGIKEIFHFASHIVRLTWIILLSLLLTAGLFLQAPWKVTTLVFIFLLAATILPRVYRKWFWAGVGCAAAAVAIWVLLPEDDKGWRPYVFDKEIAALEAKYAIPDNENAAVIYNQLLDDYETGSFLSGLTTSDLHKLPMIEPWLSNEHPEIAAWLEKHRATMSKLQSASQIKHCQFAIKPDFASLGNMLYRLKTTKRWAHLLMSAANNDIAEGRVNEGLDKYIAVLELGKHQNQQLSLTDFMVGTGIERSSASQLKRFAVIGDATDERLNIIEQTLAEIRHDWSHDLPRVLDYEKLQTKRFWRGFYEVNQQGETRFTRGLDDIQRKQFSQNNIKDGLLTTYWNRSLMKAWSLSYWLYMPPTPQQAGSVVDEAYRKYYAMGEPGFNWRKKPKKLSIKSIKFNYHYIVDMQLDMLEPIYYNIHDAYLRTIAQERGARVTIALRHYKNKNGNWPKSLDDIRPLAAEEIFIDPTNNSSFVYHKITDEDFALYSKGRNNKDQGCRHNSDDWSIWPPIGLDYKAE